MVRASEGMVISQVQTALEEREDGPWWKATVEAAEETEHSEEDPEAEEEEREHGERIRTCEDITSSGVPGVPGS